MMLVTEQEVALAAHYMGYDLLKMPKGYALRRDRDPRGAEIIEASTLELIADFLKH
jgi:hypothetical protein